MVLMGIYHIGLVSGNTAKVGMLLSAALIVIDLIGQYRYNHYGQVSCDDCIHKNEQHQNPTCLMRTYQSSFGYMPNIMIEPLCAFENNGKCTDFKQK